MDNAFFVLLLRKPATLPLQTQYLNRLHKRPIVLEHLRKTVVQKLLMEIGSCVLSGSLT